MFETLFFNTFLPTRLGSAISGNILHTCAKRQQSIFFQGASHILCPQGEYQIAVDDFRSTVSFVCLFLLPQARQILHLHHWQKASFCAGRRAFGIASQQVYGFLDVVFFAVGSLCINANIVNAVGHV